MTPYRKSLVLFVVFIIVFELLVILVGDAVRPGWSHWSDEWHFQNTIKRFGHEISLYNLKHYEEMSTPLPFLIYALWGRLVGFELFHLRMLSLIIAILTYVAFHRLLFNTLKDSRKVFWAGAFLVAQPYMIGLSIFVFTDMTAILFMVLTCLAFLKRRPILFGAFMIMAILSRQYIAFLTLAAGIYFLVDYIRVRRRSSLLMLISSVVAVVPYVLLVLWWGGPTPDNTMQYRYLDYGFTFNPHALSLYIGLIWVYGFPLLLYYWRKFYRDYRIWIAAVILSVFYILFPVGPSQPTINVGISTVGLFHRLLKALLLGDIWIQAVFCLSFLMAMPVLLKLARDCYARMRRHVHDMALFLDLGILAFFAVMPFSYLSWEKYLMPLLPLLILRVMLAGWQPESPENR